MHQTRSGPGCSGPSLSGPPAEAADRAGQASLAEAAALATRLIMRGQGPVVPAAEAAELERSVLALLRAASTLRAYPLRNSDEPMTVNGRGPGEPA